MEAGGGVPGWNVHQVGQWLTEGLGLPPDLAVNFAKNAVDGDDLAQLTDDDLTTQLGCTPLQARKIRSHLTKLGVAPPAGGSAAASAASLAAESAASAPQLAAAPCAAAAAEPDACTSFEGGDLRRYKQVKQKEAELSAQQPGAKVQQATAHLASTVRRNEAAQAALPPLRHALDKARATVSKYSGETFSLAKVFTTQHHMHAKLDEAQAQAKQLQEQLAAAEAAAAAAQGDVAEARRQLAAWQGTAAELASVQRGIKEQVEQMFAAPAWRASPRLCQLSDALRLADAEAAEARKGVDTYGRGAQLLGESSQLLAAAMQNLQQTQMFGMMELGMGIGMGGGFGRPVPGHLFDDLIEMGLIRRANDEIQAAAMKAYEAQTILPGSAPQIDSRVLGAAKLGIFQNILFGGLGSDMVQLAMVRRSKQDVEGMQAQVGQAAAWARSNLAAYQQRAAAAQTVQAARAGELGSFREAALAAALATGGA